MPLPQEVEDWKKELELSPEEQAQFDALFGKPERQTKVKTGVMFQRDYTKKTQELAKQKEALEAEIAEKQRIVTEDAQALGTWKQSADKTIQDNLKALEDAKLKAYKLEQKMQSLATQYGVDPKELGIEGEPAKPPEPKPAAPAPSDLDKLYLTRKDAESLVAEVKSNPFIAAELEDIVDEHRTLFNKGLNRRELVANALKNKRTLREEWEESQKVGDRRKELQEREIETRIKAKVDEERTKILSEHKLPVTRGDRAGSPILGMRDSLKLEGTDRSKQDSTSAVDAAVASYNVRKYEVKQPQAETKTT